MLVKKISKSDFTSGLDLARFKDDLVKANLNGVVETLDDKITHLFINGDTALNNIIDIKKRLTMWSRIILDCRLMTKYYS